MLTDDEQAILADNQDAHDYASRYLAAVDLEMFSRGQVLTAATETFRKFVDLPETSSKLKAIFETALTALALVQPELFLVKFLGEEAKAVTLALTIAEATGSKAAMAVKVAGKIGEGAEKVKGVKEKVEAFQEKRERKRQAPEAAEKLSQLDTDLDPVIRLIESYAKAQDVWSNALTVLDKEFANRLAGKSGPSKETMLAIASRLLKPPARFSKEDLHQLRLAYLWELISAWIKGGAVKIIDIPPERGLPGKYHIEGLNNTQQSTLEEWFGFKAPRGRIFYKPPFPYLTMTLSMMGAKTEKRKKYPWLTH